MKAHRSRGFTLTELLVGVVVMLVLGAILISAGQFARTLARASQCVNHLRQITLAAHHYSIDHDQNSPLPAARNPDGNANTAWHRFLWPYLGGRQVSRDESDFNEVMAQVAMGKAKWVLQCPEDTDDKITLGYAMNNAFQGQKLLGRPRTVLLMDFMDISTTSGGPKQLARLALRHRNKANVAFLDGHVEAMDHRTLPDKTVNPALWTPSAP